MPTTRFQFKTVGYCYYTGIPSTPTHMHCFPCSIRGSSSYTPAAKIPIENLLQLHMNPQNPVHQSGKNLMTLAGVVEDETAHTRNIEQLQLEIDKPKPRLDVVHT